MEKVSFVQAISKTHLLLTSRKGIFGLYALLFFSLGLWMDSFGFEAETSDMLARHVGVLILGCCLYFIVDLSLSNFTVASLRNKTSFFPDNPLWGVASYYLYTLAISLIVGAVVVAGLIPSGIWLAFTMDLSSGIVPESIGVPFYLLMIPGGLLAVFLIARLIMALFSVAVGDSHGLTDSWRMTKGCSIKLTIILALGMALEIGFDIVCVTLFDLEFGNLPLMFTVVSNVVSVAVCVWMNTYMAVIYEDLRQRYVASVQGAPAIDPAGVADAVLTPTRK